VLVRYPELSQTYMYNMAAVYEWAESNSVNVGLHCGEEDAVRCKKASKRA
jgi:hypothetical protein